MVKLWIVTPDAESSNLSTYHMRIVCFQISKLIHLNLFKVLPCEVNYNMFSRTWVNFFKESFLNDYIQKMFTSKILSNYIIYGAVYLLLRIINSIQLYFFVKFLNMSFNYMSYNFNSYNIYNLLIWVLRSFLILQATVFILFFLI